jgi:hypothetical protein
MRKATPLCGILLLALIPLHVMAQGVPAAPGAGQGAPTAHPPAPVSPPDLNSVETQISIDPSQGVSTNKKPKKRTDFIVAPVPFSNPTIGTGLALGGALIFPIDPRDTKSPPSILGAGAMASDNGTNGFLIGGNFYLNRDRYRILTGLVHADINYDYFGIGGQASGNSIPIGQRIDGLLVEGLARTKHDIFLGLRYIGATSSVTVRAGSDSPLAQGLQGRELSTNISAFIPRLLRDTRNNTFYPTRGAMLDLQAGFHSPALGDSYDYQTYSLLYSGYRALGKERVFAYKGYARALSGSAPFFALSTVGGSDGLRGYPIGRFRDNSLLSVQAEYRQFFRSRFGFALFTGISAVGPNLGAMDWEDPAPSIGIGVRLRLSKENPVSYRIDYAIGTHSNALYFAVGEAF